MERHLPAKGTSGCLSNCFSYYSFSSSTTPSWVPLLLFRTLRGLPAQRGERVLVWPTEENCRSAEWPVAANWDAQGNLASACSHSFHTYFTESVCASSVKFFLLAVSTVEVKRNIFIDKLAMFLRDSVRISYLVPSYSVSCPKRSKCIRCVGAAMPHMKEVFLYTI